MAKKATKGKTAKKKEREKKEEKKEKEKERRERVKERKEEMKNKLNKLNNIKKKRALKNNPYIINKKFMDQLRRDLSVEQKTKREERKEKKREETKEKKREEIKEEKTTTTIINNNLIVVASSSESNSYSSMSKYNFSDVSVPKLPTAPPRPLEKYTPSKIPYYNDYINRDFLRKISNFLKKKPFISGDEYSFNDYCLYQKLKMYFEENNEEKEIYPNIKKYMIMIKNVKNLEYKSRVLEKFTKKIYKKYKEEREERENNEKSETSKIISVSDSERERRAAAGAMMPPIEMKQTKKNEKKKIKKLE